MVSLFNYYITLLTWVGNASSLDLGFIVGPVHLHEKVYSKFPSLIDTFRYKWLPLKTRKIRKIENAGW
jgi:hypothetical protein